MKTTGKGGAAAAEALARGMVTLGVLGLLAVGMAVVVNRLSSDALGLLLGLLLGAVVFAAGALLITLSAPRRAEVSPTPAPPTANRAQLLIVEGRPGEPPAAILPDGRRVLLVDAEQATPRALAMREYQETIR